MRVAGKGAFDGEIVAPGQREMGGDGRVALGMLLSPGVEPDGVAAGVYMLGLQPHFWKSSNGGPPIMQITA